MENNLTIKERILSFLESQGIKKVVKVLTIYPNLSAEWLLRGEGEMLKSLSNQVENKVIKIENNKDSELPHTILDKFLTTIQGQAEEIGVLKARIKDLEQRLGKTAGDVNIGATANVG
mgnify:CR=1 FL=1